MSNPLVYPSVAVLIQIPAIRIKCKEATFCLRFSEIFHPKQFKLLKQNDIRVFLAVKQDIPDSGEAIKNGISIVKAQIITIVVFAGHTITI